MEVILLERVENLGQMGDVVRVKPGYARNYLLPQVKALRATKDNMAYFDQQKVQLEALNLKRKGEAEKVAKKLDGMTVLVIRQAAESGQLYGSVTAGDIADSVIAEGIQIARSQVRLNQNYKTIGLFPVRIVLHPEVDVVVTINIARSADEAKIQEKKGGALITTEEGETTVVSAEEAEQVAEEAKAEQIAELTGEAEEEAAEEVKAEAEEAPAEEAEAEAEEPAEEEKAEAKA